MKLIQPTIIFGLITLVSAQSACNSVASAIPTCAVSLGFSDIQTITITVTHNYTHRYANNIFSLVASLLLVPR